MRTFVLLPGAGGTSWYWSRVVALLEAAGHQAVAVDFPSDDESAGLAEYADLTVTAVAAAAGREVALVAQSLGGFTAAMVCAQIEVESLTLVNAMIPLPGETPGQWWAATGAIEARDAAAAAGRYGPFDLATYFLHDVAPDIAAEGERYQHAEADAVFASVCDFSGWPAVPTRVLAGEDDRFFPLGFQRVVARERLGIDADVLPGGHLIALSQPALVAYYLMG